MSNVPDARLYCFLSTVLFVCLCCSIDHIFLEITALFTALDASQYTGVGKKYQKQIRSLFCRTGSNGTPFAKYRID